MKILTFKVSDTVFDKLIEFCEKHSTNRNVVLRQLLIDALTLTTKTEKDDEFEPTTT